MANLQLPLNQDHEGKSVDSTESRSSQLGGRICQFVRPSSRRYRRHSEGRKEAGKKYQVEYMGRLGFAAPASYYTYRVAIYASTVLCMHREGGKIRWRRQLSGSRQADGRT